MRVVVVIGATYPGQRAAVALGRDGGFAKIRVPGNSQREVSATARPGMVRVMKKDDIERYRGRWVAVDKAGEVLADAAELGILLDQASKAGLSATTVHRVPALDEPLFVGLG